MNTQDNVAPWLIEEAVDRLSCELSHCAYQVAELGSNCSKQEDVTYYSDLYEKYNLGIHLCQKYVYQILNLEEFCEAMVDADLKCFLIKIEKYLPESLVTEYKLNETSDYESSGSDQEEES